MSDKSSRHIVVPGVQRENRISDDGLERLRKQLSSGVNPSLPVRKQWLKRYGKSASDIFHEFGIVCE